MNLRPSPQGSRPARQDPRRLAALRGSGPAREREHYGVDQYVPYAGRAGRRGGLAFKVFAGSGELPSGGNRHDYLGGGSGADTVDGGDNDDRLDGGVGHDRLAGDDRDNRLDGFGGDNMLVGHRGADKLFGSDGDDFLVAITGFESPPEDGARDFVSGGGGTDTCVYSKTDPDDAPAARSELRGSRGDAPTCPYKRRGAPAGAPRTRSDPSPG